MSKPELLIESDGAVDRLTLSRPKSLNALSPSMVEGLLRYFDELRHRTTTRVVIFSGEGGHFCAGLDIKEELPVLKEGPGYAMNFMADFGDIILRMRRCPQPIVGLLKGAASGAGFALALACDIRVATSDLRMNAAFIKLGLSGSEMGLSFLLSRIVGAGLASELMLTGRFIKAKEAEHTGLISRIIKQDKLEQEGKEVAAQLLATGPLGLRLTKEAINLSLGASTLESAIAFDNRNQSLGFVSRMPEEGIAAFKEKREPVFNDA